MNHVHRIWRSLARRACFLLPRRPAGTAAAAATRPEPPGWATHPPLLSAAGTIAVSEPRVGVRPQLPRTRLYARAAPVWLPHTIQLCIHCRENPAGFWVSRTGGKTVRRPWCLSCCEGLDRDCCDMIPFDS